MQLKILQKAIPYQEIKVNYRERIGVSKISGTVKGTIFAGIPSRKIKDIDPKLQKGEIERIAKNYLIYSSWFKTDSE